MNISEKDLEVLRYIQVFRNFKQFSPTVEEISKALYISKTAVHRHIMRLCEMGYISIEPKQPRTIVIKIAV